MRPHDQIDRDWSKGNCFEVALQFIKDSEELRAGSGIPENATVRLVHGLLDSKVKKLKHAWVEIDDHVLDHSNNQAINGTTSEYYSSNSALPVRRFSRAEADAILGALRTADGKLPVGYWGELPDDTVAGAMLNYEEAKGVFASGVCFSDPSDPANHENIVSDGEQRPDAP